jgi:hypothetical protein
MWRQIGGMNRRPLVVVLWEMVKSPFLWLAPIVGIAGFYQNIIRGIYPDLRPIGLILPPLAWLTIFISIILLASFHANYKLAQKLQPTLRSDIDKLLEKRRLEGFEIRKKKAAGWQDQAASWYGNVLADLSLIKGDHFSKLFNIEIGRKPKFKNSMGEKDWTIIINGTCDDLKALQATLRDDQILRSDKLTALLMTELVT